MEKTDIKTLYHTSQRSYDTIQIDCYEPEEMQMDRVCLIFGVWFALCANEKEGYKFQYLMLRRSQIYHEPIVYRDKTKLVLSEMCQAISHSQGDLGSIYINLYDTVSGNQIGISLWNYRNRSISVAYQRDHIDVARLDRYINQVYTLMQNNLSKLLPKLSVNDTIIYRDGYQWQAIESDTMEKKM